MNGDIILQPVAPLDKKKRIMKVVVIIAVLVLVLVGLAVLVWQLIPKRQDKVTVQNANELGLSGQSFDEFRLYLLDQLEQQGYVEKGIDVSDVAVREGSVESFTEKVGTDKVMKTTSFLVDIDSIQQTFRVKVYDYTGTLTDLPVMINCPMASETKYPGSECNGVYGSTSKSIRNNLPHEIKLTTGEKVLVKSIGVTRDGQQLVQVYLYSCNEKNPPLTETERAVKNWVEALGDPAREYYTYNIRPGYCEGDAI